MAKCENCGKEVTKRKKYVRAGQKDLMVCADCNEKLSSEDYVKMCNLIMNPNNK